MPCNKAIITCSIMGITLLIIGILTANGTSFKGKGAMQGSQSACEVSVSMTEFTHCTEGTYSIADFCEWDRKGTLRSRFCGQSLAVEVMMYAAGGIILLTSLLGFLFSLCGKIQQLFMGVVIFVLWILAAILCVVIAVIWSSAKGALPGLKFDVRGERGSEWGYFPSSHPGTVEWDIAWACVLTYVGAVVACGSAVCGLFGIMNLCDGIVIRVDMQADIADCDAVGGMFIDAAIGTTCVIKGVPVEPAKEKVPVENTVSVEVHADVEQRERCEASPTSASQV